MENVLISDNYNKLKEMIGTRWIDRKYGVYKVEVIGFEYVCKKPDVISVIKLKGDTGINHKWEYESFIECYKEIINE